MDIEKLIDRVADKNGVPLERATRNSIRMRLKHAGFVSNEIPENDVRMVRDIIGSMIPSSKNVKEAGVIKVASITNCPRCSNICADIRLADMSSAKYCKSCHITVVV